MSKQLRRIGYIRISPTDQNPDVQAEALKQSGCAELHEGDCQIDPRQALKELLALLNEGDTLIVYRLDRLGRDEHTMVHFQEQLQARNVTLVATAAAAETRGGGHEE